MEHDLAQMYAGPLGRLVDPVARRIRDRGLLTRHRAIWRAHRVLWRLTGSHRVHYDHHDLEVDRLDSLALAKGWYEPDETAWYDEFVRHGDLVVECGANIGVFTLQLARLVGPEGRVISYEPDPSLRRILERNVSVNGYGNVLVRPFAVADEPGEMSFYRAPKNQGDNRLFSHGPGDESFPVQVVRMDDDLPDDGRRIDLLKIDIQGAEPLALRGLGHTLHSLPPRRLLMEFWPHGIIGMGGDPRALIQWLRELGYSITELVSGREFDLEQALREMTVDNLKWANLVCVHATADEGLG